MIDILLLLIGAHFLCDYPLQGDFLAKAKNRDVPIPGVPWYQAMVAHVSIHGLAVGLITGAWWIAILELISHFIIDDLKCRKIIGFNTDQLLHIVCKLLWVGLLLI